MYDRLDLSSILFFDIECVPGAATLREVDPALADIWRDKAPRLLRTEGPSDQEIARGYTDLAGIHAEFGRVVCISVGIVTGAPGSEQLRIKSFADAEEAKLLRAFENLLTRNPNLRYFCGHNIREFDVPYVGRRMLIHRMSLPKMLDLRGKKPWESKHLLDTMEMWSFGERGSFVSLKLLAALFGVPSPKNDIDGSEVGRVFYNDEGVDGGTGLERITKYCERDVIATANVFFALLGKEPIPTERIQHV